MKDYLQPLSDAQLEALAASGDRDAFGALYERHADRVYDFLLRMLQDPEEAADLMQETFVRAIKSLSTERAGQAAFSTWLLTIARNLALTRIDRRKRTVSMAREEEDEDEPAFYDFADTSWLANPQEAAEAKEIAVLVWQAAAALDRKQYSLLDLHVRQGLDSAEIATVLGISKGNAYTMLSRLKNAFEEAVATLVMLKRGRRYCPELDQLVREYRLQEVSVSARKLISKHTAACAVCRHQQGRLVSAEAVLRSLAPLPLPLLLKQKALIAALHTSSTLGGSGAGESSGSALHAIRKTFENRTSPVISRAAGVPRAGKALMSVAILAVIVAALLAGWFITRGESEPAVTLVSQVAKATARATPSATAFASATATQAPTCTPSPTSTPPRVRSQTSGAPLVAIVPPFIAPPAPPPTSVPPTTTPTPRSESAADGHCEDITGPALPGETEGFNAQLEAQIAQQENQYRAGQGLPPLMPDGRVQSVAGAQARSLVQNGWIDSYPDHVGPDGRTVGERLAAAGLVYPENVAFYAENHYWGINVANSCRIFDRLTPRHFVNITADRIYDAPQGYFYGVGCYFRYAPGLQFVCIADYVALK